MATSLARRMIWASHARHYTGGWKNMAYKRFSISVVLQLILILLVLVCISTLFFVFDRTQYIYTFIVLFSLLAVQVYYLLRFITRTNRELAKFIDGIKQEDYSLKYPSSGIKNSVSDLHNSFNTIIETFQQIKIEREIQFNFLQLIVENIEIGILAINDKEEIVLMNTAAEKILGVRKSKTWKQLKDKTGQFCEEAENIFSGGKKLFEQKQKNNSLKISIEVIPTTLLDQPHKLITLNNIKKEIEQKELDAWIKLIRVLNHEIMNSTTPISSLTETIIMMLEDKQSGQKPIRDLDEEIISDVIGSAKTIQKRSDGLFDFVNEYRKLTKVPPPKIENVRIKEIFDDVFKLMEPSFNEKSIVFSMNIDPEELSIAMDPNLIEQVLINLIKNALEALVETKNPAIRILAYLEGDQACISIIDNGPGIDPELMEEIFVPFFSTKEEGSGIGLSLSRQIMNRHGGTIRIHSGINEGTEVVLSF